jgi:hypothetical protein
VMPMARNDGDVAGLGASVLNPFHPIPSRRPHR